MADYAQEQEMEIEALQAILMNDFKGKHLSNGERARPPRTQLARKEVACPERGGDENYRDDDIDESKVISVQLALIFSHTEKYPDEPPLLNVRSLRGMQGEDLKDLKWKLEQEASENLGMAMVYTLVTSTQEWLTERFSSHGATDDSEEEDTEKDDIVVPHGEPVIVETFLAWREQYEAEIALEQAKLMPESVLSAPKEKKLTGRQWFESGRAAVKGAATTAEGSEDEEEEDIDFDDEDFEDDEEDMLEHYLAKE